MTRCRVRGAGAEPVKMKTMTPTKPSHWHYHPAIPSGDELSFGDQAADKMRHGLGSWTFVFSFMALMAIWVGINVSVAAFDPYPFILLNLMLSTLAGLQGAVLLIAAKRADAISAALAKYHLEVSEEMRAMISEIHEIQVRLDDRNAS